MISEYTDTQQEKQDPTSTRNLILSFATNAKFGDFARFLLSARQFCSAETTDIVMFVEPQIAPRFAELANELQVTLIPVCSLWRETSENVFLKVLYRGLLLTLQLGASITSSQAFAQVYRATTSNWIHPQSGRFLVYQDFLSANPTYRCVLLSDSRDVIFQDNPFAHVDPNILHVFEQDRSMLYGGDNLDSKWLADVMGNDVLEAIRGKQTICSGTIIGSPSILLQYLALMEKEILSHKYRPIDQPMHNKVVYLDWSPELLASHSNLSGLIFTIAETSESDYEIKDNQVLINNKVVPVLHQYDRVPKLKSMVHALYPTAFGYPIAGD
ncbi:MAG TPA: hypothetical protein V6C91_16370 [Coleofasciculaceae cyanobacterium]